MIESLDGFFPARVAAAGKVTDLDVGLGINGDSQRVRLGRTLLAGRVDVGKDRVNFGNFFRGGF